MEPEVNQLSAIVREGLRSLSSAISPELSKKVICNAVKMALHSNVPGNPEIYATRADHTKQAEYATLTLFVVALKHGWSADRMRSVLEAPDLRLAPVAIDELVDAFAAHRQELHVLGVTTGASLPHLTDVEWKLSCDVRSSQMQPGAGNDGGTAGGSALNYTISLGRYAAEASGGERESIATFQCNVEELQALVGRLKEVERHCDRLAREK